MFVYSQLQNILLDKFLGCISDWDSNLKLDLTQTDFLFRKVDDFVLISDCHQLVTSSILPTPGKFNDQSISLYKVFCRIVLQHKIVKSDLIRRLSCFDLAMVLDGEDERYLHAIERLTSYFVSSHGWMTASDKQKQSVSSRLWCLNFDRFKLIEQVTCSYFNLAPTSSIVEQSYTRCSNTLACVFHQWRKFLSGLLYH